MSFIVFGERDEEAREKKTAAQELPCFHVCIRFIKRCQNRYDPGDRINQKLIVYLVFGI